MEEYLDQIELVELIKNIVKKMTSDECDFGAYVDLQAALNRELCLGDIQLGTGAALESYIKFWNNYDETHNIPVEERKPIKIYIDSYGGSLTDTFTIVDAIALSKTPVWTINIGKAYSGGFFAFVAGHKRFAYPSASFLFHEGSCGNAGDAGKFRNFAVFYEKQLNMLKNIVLQYTTISEEEYEKHIKDDWWFTSEEALTYSICDEISKEFV